MKAECDAGFYTPEAPELVAVTIDCRCEMAPAAPVEARWKPRWKPGGAAGGAAGGGVTRCPQPTPAANYALAICDRCGCRTRYLELRNQIVNSAPTGLKAPDCLDQDHPQLKLNKVPDLRSARPDSRAVRSTSSTSASCSDWSWGGSPEVA